MKRIVSLALVVAAWMAGTTALRAQTVVILDTTKGKIVVELEDQKAPNTVKNFLKYVDDKHYDNTIFHRVIPGFMVQTGGLTDDMREKQGRDPIKNESNNGLQNRRGTLAMARTNDPDSATSQFFINVKDNDGLNRATAQDGVGYACLHHKPGHGGMDVVDAIVNAPTTNRRGGHAERAADAEPIFIRSARRRTGGYADVENLETSGGGLSRRTGSTLEYLSGGDKSRTARQWLAIVARLDVRSRSPLAPDNPVVVFDTTMGKEDRRRARREERLRSPSRTSSKYLDDKHYDGTIFHRVTSPASSSRGAATLPT